MINPIDKILTEWAYRVHNGMPDPSDNYHLVQLDEAMTSMKLPKGFKHGLLKRLREIDFANQASFKDYNKKHKMRPDTKVTIGGKDTTAGEAEKDKGQQPDENRDKDHHSTDAALNYTKTQEKKDIETGTSDFEKGAGTHVSRAGEAATHKALRMLKEGKSYEEI